MSITSFSLFLRGGRVIFWAVLLSLLLHLWLLFMSHIDLSLPQAAETKRLDADLVTMIKIRITDAPIVASHSAPRPRPQPKKSAPAEPSQPALREGVSTTPATAEESVMPEPPSESPAATEKVVRAEETKPPQSQEVAPEPRPPLNLMVKYGLYKGTDGGMKVGKVVHTWEISDGRYVLTSVMEGAGIFALLKRGMFIQSSQGRITAIGLEPEQYWEQRGQEADRTYNAQFDYQNRTLTYGRVSEPTTVALPSGTQDQLSFVYQFALQAPFSGEVTLSMTNGRKLGIYHYQVVGEETINTGAGELRTLHLSKVLKQPGDDSVDVWLAADHQYLPAKVRLANGNGDVVEQVVEGIEGK